MIYPLEFQILRNMQPVTRGLPMNYEPAKNVGDKPVWMVSVPRLADSITPPPAVSGIPTNPLRWPELTFEPQWEGVPDFPFQPFLVGLRIDGIPMGRKRWGFLWMLPSDGPSLNVHFPPEMSESVDPYLSALWTVYGRCADVAS